MVAAAHPNRRRVDQNIWFGGSITIHRSEGRPGDPRCLGLQVRRQRRFLPGPAAHQARGTRASRPSRNDEYDSPADEKERHRGSKSVVSAAEALQGRTRTVEAPASRKTSNQTHRSRTDPDATPAQKRGTPRQLKYKVHRSISSATRTSCFAKATSSRSDAASAESHHSDVFPPIWKLC